MHAHSLSRLLGLFLTATSYDIIADVHLKFTSMMLGDASKPVSHLDLQSSRNNNPSRMSATQNMLGSIWVDKTFNKDPKI